MTKIPLSLRRRSLAIVASALVGGTLLMPQARGTTSPSMRVRGPYKLAAGITLRTVSYATPEQVRILAIRPQGNSATVEGDVSGPQFGDYRVVSGMAASNGAIAAVNGDFGSFSGYPSHWNLIDGALRTSGIQGNQAFAIDKAGDKAWAGTPPGKITASAPGEKFVVDHWNAGAAGPSEVIAFTPVGGDKQKPATDMCAARLVPAGGFGWSDSSKTGISRDYTVKAQPEPCVFAAMDFGSNASPGDVILQVRRSCACSTTITDLTPGDNVTLTWESWPGVIDELGAQPQLVQNGTNVAPGPNTSTNYFYGKNPRTGVGISQGCTDSDPTTNCVIYIITVDGRQSGWSVGMTLPQFADLFLGLNPPAYDAVNLDGGGATEMWVGVRNSAYCQSAPPAGGCLVNRPSDGAERPNVTSLQVLSGSDGDFPGGL